MRITDVQDYVAALEEQRHLEGMIERGRKEFSGYGLELFERGLRKKLARVTDAIVQREAQSDHTVRACDWSGYENLRSFTCDVAGRYIFDPSSIANFSNCIVTNCNVQMLQGPINLYRSIRLNPVLAAHASQDRFDVIGSYMPRVTGLPSEVHAGPSCYYSA